MEITEENDYQNLKDFFWEANRAFMEKNIALCFLSYTCKETMLDY